MKKRVYVAAPFGEWAAVQRLSTQLEQMGHETMSSWAAIAEDLDGDCSHIPVGDQRRRNNAHLDMHDVKHSDAVIVLVPETGGTGMWVEVGMALAWGKRVLCVGPALRRTIFCELCEVHETTEDALGAIGEVSS